MLCLAICLPLLLSACEAGSSDADPTPTETGGLPVATEPAIQSPTPAVTPEPTRSVALEALLAPGPTLSAPEGLFFQHDDAIWYLPVNEPARPVIEDQRIGPWAPSFDGNQIALVRYRDDDGQGVEELLIVGRDASLSVIYGPTPTSGPAGAATIREIAWAWDNLALAATFSDGTIAVMRFAPDDPFRSRPPFEPVASSHNTPPTGLTWAPNGAGFAYLEPAGDDVALVALPIGEDPQPVVSSASTPSRSVSSYHWLPGRGRIAFVESVAGSGAHLPGSIFTIAPDGALLELLVSAGQFAPAATVGALSASPDGRELAFAVQTPDRQGRPAFQSLWILSIDSGELRQVPIETGYRVVDMTWTASGLVWRGIDRSIRPPADGRPFTGSEEFILGRFNSADGTSTIVFQSTLSP